jgi:hypothetical protein
MPQPFSVIHGLPRAKLSGVRSPEYDTAGFDFSHDHGERRWYRVPRGAHRWTGIAPESLPFTFYFLNSIEKGAFPGLWNQWWPLLQNGEPQPMVHPILGPILVVVRSGSVKLEARNTSGIVVSVNFTRTVIDPADDQDTEATKASVSELAAKADAALVDSGIPYVPSMPEADFFDLLAQIDGLIVSAQLDALALVNEAKGYIETMVEFAEKGIANADPRHGAAAAIDALIALWAGLTDTAEKLGARTSRKTAEETLAADTTLDGFAQAHGNKLEDVISLNVNALAYPTVPKGTVLTYYTEGV